MKSFLFIMALLLPTAASGGLVIHVSGLSGGATTTWVFSGYGTKTGAGSTGNSRAEWVGGNFALGSFNNVTADSGRVTITGSALSSSVSTSQLSISNGGVDSFALRGDAAKVDFVVGSVAWSGTLIVPISIDDLSETPLPTLISSLAPETGNNDRAFTGVNLDLYLNQTAVPEPAHLSVLCGVALIVFVRHRRRQAGARRCAVDGSDGK